MSPRRSLGEELPIYLPAFVGEASQNRMMVDFVAVDKGPSPKIVSAVVWPISR